MSGCASKTWRSKVEPDRAAQSTNTGRGSSRSLMAGVGLQVKFLHLKDAPRDRKLHIGEIAGLLGSELIHAGPMGQGFRFGNGRVRAIVEAAPEAVHPGNYMSRVRTAPCYRQRRSGVHK
jgi:hypothetical protein